LTIKADRLLTVFIDEGVAGGLVSDSEHVLALVSLTNVHDLDNVLQREHLNMLEKKDDPGVALVSGSTWL